MRKQLQCILLKATSVLLFAFFLLASSNIIAQTGNKVAGIILDSAGSPLAGATIMVKQSHKVTISDASGKFTVDAMPKQTLVVSMVGYEEKEFAVGRQNNFSISLSTTTNALNDVVVVGYGTVRRKDLTGSVGVVKVDDAKKTATYDVAKMLQGQVAGVEVQGSGEPGGYVQLKIRGIGTLSNNAPLFVIDGVIIDAPYDFSPGDIESLQVLKDASAAAIYGSRGLNGVIIITTKKGRNGPLKVNYNGYVGFQRVPKTIDVLDRVGYQKVTSAAEINAGLSVAPANDPNNPAFIRNVNTDWQKETFKTGVINDHNINFSGGNESAAYNVNMGYFDQSSTYKGPQNYTRYSFDANLTGKKGIFSYGAKLAYTQSHKVNPNNGIQYHAVFGGNVTGVLTAIPTMPVYDSTRLRGYGGSDNVTQRAITLNVVGLNNVITDYSDRNRVLGNFWGEVEIVKNLKYRLNVSYDRTDFKNFHFEPTFDLGFYYLNTQSYMFQQTGTGYRGLVENTLTYNLHVGKHKVDFLAGYTYEYDHDENTAASAVNLPEPYYYTFNSVSDPASKGIGSGLGSNSIISYLGRINYNYDDKYLLTVNFRRDGSSVFSPSFRYGNYPSIAAAWNLHNERFFHLPSFINTLKLRGGYGILGSQDIPRYAYDAYVNTNAGYVFGNTLAPGTTTISIVDSKIKWESKTTSNAAADIGLLNNHLTLTAEYYNNKSEDILTTLPTTLYIGSVPASILTNAASLQNNGFEFTVAYQGGKGKFKYNISGNIATIKNKVLELGGTNNPIYGAGSKTEVGRSVGEIFGWQTEGIFQNADEVSKHALQIGAKPGDIMFKDVNGDGAITDNDRVYLGTTVPKINYGVNFSASYKDFDMSFFLQGNAGNKVFNGVYRDLMTEQYGNSSVDALNYWTPANTNTNVPRPVIYDPNGNARVSDRFIESGTYLKLQNAQIGYSLPVSALAKTRAITSARIYVAGQNLITFSGYKGYDPDFISDGLFSRGYDYGSFPNPRTFQVGVQVGF